MIIILTQRTSSLCTDWDRIPILVNMDNSLTIEPYSLTEKGSTIKMIGNEFVKVHETVEEINQIIKLHYHD